MFLHPKFRTILFLLSVVFLFHNCQPDKENLTIAFSKAKPDEYYGNYPKWIHKANSEVNIINLYELGLDSALMVLNQCDGLIITGGADVYPDWFGKVGDTARCGEFDRYRDTLEIELIKKAIHLKMPLIGICRGEQIINVTLGGSLIIDIPGDHDTLVKHRLVDWENCYHDVEVMKGSLLSILCQGNDKKVNSNHHQAIDMLSPQLKITALAEDGIIEAVEWKDPTNKNFMMAVQWHPERLDSVNAVLSMPIAKEFLIQASQYKADKK